MEGLHVELKKIVMNMLLIPRNYSTRPMNIFSISLSLKSDFQVYLSIDITRALNKV